MVRVGAGVDDVTRILVERILSHLSVSSSVIRVERTYSQTIANTEVLEVDWCSRNTLVRDTRVLLQEVSVCAFSESASHTSGIETYAAKVGP